MRGQLGALGIKQVVCAEVVGLIPPSYNSFGDTMYVFWKFAFAVAEGEAAGKQFKSRLSLGLI